MQSTLDSIKYKILADLSLQHTYSQSYFRIDHNVKVSVKDHTELTATSKQISPSFKEATTAQSLDVNAHHLLLVIFLYE